MSLIQVGNCNLCGAPIYQPSVWMGIIPPAIQRTCGCKSGSTRIYVHETTQPQPTVKFPVYQIKNSKVDIINALKRYREDVDSKAELAAFEAVIEWFINCTPEYKGD